MVNGRRNRRRGNDAELGAAAWLRDHLDVEVRTSRDGRGGAQGLSDLQWCDDDGRWWPGVRGWTLEVKDVSSRSVPKWIRQARTAAAVEANDRWAVVHKRRNHGWGDADVHVPAGMLRHVLEDGEPDPSGYPDTLYVTLSLAAFAEVVW